MPISMNNTTLTFNDATTQTTAGQPGTVTSVATGNGLSGGTITTTGTLTVACPTFNTVGSYVFGGQGADSSSKASGTNYAAGSGIGQVGYSYALYVDYGVSPATVNSEVTENLSGTWKWMSAAVTSKQSIFGLMCRVS